MAAILSAILNFRWTTIFFRTDGHSEPPCQISCLYHKMHDFSLICLAIYGFDQIRKIRHFGFNINIVNMGCKEIYIPRPCYSDDWFSFLFSGAEKTPDNKIINYKKKRSDDF